MQTVCLEVVEGTLGDLDDLHGMLVLLQRLLHVSFDGLDSVALIQNSVQIRNEVAVVLPVGSDDEEGVHNTGDVGIGDLVFHGDLNQTLGLLGVSGVVALGHGSGRQDCQPRCVYE